MWRAGWLSRWGLPIVSQLILGLLFLVASPLTPPAGTALAQSSLQRTLPAGWSLVSIPLQPADPSPNAVFADVPPPLRLYAYGGGQVLGLGELGFPQVAPGQAYWLLLPADTTIQVTGEQVNTGAEFRKSISEGWNLLGDPWLSTIDWDDSRVSISHGTTTLPLSQAVAQGWVMDTIFGYDPTIGGYTAILHNDSPAGKLLPWRGYLLLSAIDGEVVFSQPPPDTTPPTASLDSPLEDAEIKGLVDVVGTADDENLAQYTLEFRPVDSSQFTILASGTSPVVSGLLGQVDTTLLPNGPADLRLVVSDAAGNSTIISRKVLAAGQNKPGIFTITFTDLEVPVSGIPIAIKRTYDSRLRGTSMDFGYGWDLEVVRRGTYKNNRKPGDGWNVTSGGGFFNFPCTNTASTKSHITEVRFSDTEFYRFTLKLNMYGLSSTIGGGCLGDVEFIQIGGVPGARLDILDTVDVFWPNGSDYITFDPGDDRFGQIYEPQAVRLTTLDGRTFDLDLFAGLYRIGDPNGNSLTINSDGVVHSSGKSISFTRDGQGRIITITDPLGQELHYQYDAQGDLVTVTDRVGSNTSFTYDPVHDHLLKDIIDPLGNIPLRNEYDETGRLVAQIDADGNRTEITTDLVNNTTTVTDRLGIDTVMVYNDDGLVTEATTGGKTIRATYDSKGNKLTETDPLGHTTTYTYDSNNLLLSETDPLGNTTTYTYTANGRLASATDALGNTVSFTYDSRGNLLETRDENGVIVQTFSYDARGNVTQVTDSTGTTTYAYDAFGNLVQQQGTGSLEKSYTYDANGRRLTETVKRTVNGTLVSETTSYTYDANGRILTITDPLGNVTTYTYNAAGKRVSETNARGNTTTFEYDKRGNLVKKTYPDGKFELFGYDLEDRKTAHTDRAGRTTFFEYDDQDHVIKTIYPDGSFILTNYDAAGRVISTQDERGNITTYTYDDKGRQTSVTDPLGNVTQFAYNSIGARTSVTDPLGNVTQFEYDTTRFGGPLLTKTTFPGGAFTQRAYTPQGRVASVTDEAGKTTAYQYDAAGNLVKVTDALGGETTYAYDEVGNRISQTDANGHTTTFEYDANRRLTKRTLPLGQSETFTYDAVGNQVSRTDFKGQTTTYEYDSLDRLVKQTFPGGSTVTFSYTPTGKLATVTDGRGTTTYTYDLRDRLIGIENPDGTTITYTYDAAGNRTSVTTLAGTTTYQYDSANRLVKVTDPQAGETTYTYDGNGNRALVIYPNGNETHYTYDARNRLVQVKHTGPGGTPVLSQYDYTLGPTGIRTRLTESSGRVVDYTYDALYRLIQEVDNLGGSPITTTYTYDAVGNRLSMNRAGVITTYTYDGNDRMLTAGSDTFTYDANGNMTQRTSGGVTTQYTYDAQDRLVSQAVGGITTTFVYDHAGNRVSKEVGGIVTRFLVDPRDNSGLPQVVAELSGSGDLQASYVYGDDLISARRSGQSHYYHYDGLGSTRFLTDGSGAVSDTYAYDAFGNVMASTGTTPNNYLFAGEQLDPNLGFYYLRARYMSPELGRFLSADPFPGSIYDPASLHKYSYAHNNPVNNIDPTGQFSLGSVSISLSIVSILASMSVSVYKIYSTAEEVWDHIKEWLQEIPGLKLNEKATQEELGTLDIGLDIGFEADNEDGETSIGLEIGLELDVKLGDGAVAKAYAVSSSLAGDNIGTALINLLHARNAGHWMRHLPKVDGKPGHYFRCGFNNYVFEIFNLQLINQVTEYGPSQLKFGAQVLGSWLGYINFITLVGETVDDIGSGIAPLPPAGATCGIPLP